MRLLILFLGWCLCWPPLALSAQDQSDEPAARRCELRLGAAQQVFHGFGTSLLHCNAWTTRVPHDLHRRLAQATWGEGGLQTLRTWLYLPETMRADGSIDLDDYVRRYLDSRLIAEALAAGCARITLVPAQFPAHLRLDPPEAVEPVVGGHREQRVVSDDAIVAMMEAVAAAIGRLRDEHGISIAATGIQNEPNQDHGDSGYITIAQTPLAVKALRAALNRRGLQAVAIIAPETSSVDWAFSERVAALQADAEAWQALDGVAWHSYNMAMVPAIAESIRRSGKEMWMTEASANGPERANDRVAAASMAARVINDLRYGANHWIWFLGYEGSDVNDDQTRLLRIFDRHDPVDVEALGKSFPLRDLCATFVPGTTILSTSSTDLGPWTYGRKPALQVVGGQRPDGSLALAAVNFTAAEFPPAAATGGFAVENAGLSAEVLRVDCSLPVRRGTARLRRRAADLATAIDQVLPVRDGHLVFVIRPLEILSVVIEADDDGQHDLPPTQDRAEQ